MTADTKPADTKKTPIEQPKLAAHVDLLEFRNNRWRIDAGEGVTPEDIAKPGYYAVVESQFRSGDLIDVIGFGFAWRAEVLVWDRNPGYPMTIEVLRLNKCPPVPARQRAELPGHNVVFDAQTGKYFGVRTEDNKRITTPHPNFADAYNELIKSSAFRGWTEKNGQQ